MRLFHIECFITDKHVYDTMNFLEGVSARNLTVRTVKTSPSPEEANPRTYKPKKGKGWGWLIEEFQKTPEITKDELTSIYQHNGINPRGGIAAAVRNKKIKKNAKGVYVAGPTLKEAA